MTVKSFVSALLLTRGFLKLTDVLQYTVLIVNSISTITTKIIITIFVLQTRAYSFLLMSVYGLRFVERTPCKIKLQVCN